MIRTKPPRALSDRLAGLSTVSPSGCHLWNAKVHKDGYPKITIEGKRWRAHRAAWVAHKGPIPGGLHVLHTCDVRRCVNIAHLWLGTHLDNMADMMRKGRHRRGIGPRKLTDEQVIEIFRDSRDQKSLSRQYGVSQFMVSKIKRKVVHKKLLEALSG